MQEYLDKIVVVDTSSRFSYIGKLIRIDTRDNLTLQDVNIFNAHETRLSLDAFLVECAAHGCVPIRKNIWISNTILVAISLLDDIILPGK